MDGIFRVRINCRHCKMTNGSTQYFLTPHLKSRPHRFLNLGRHVGNPGLQLGFQFFRHVGNP
jgi:hypothetical protein